MAPDCDLDFEFGILHNMCGILSNDGLPFGDDWRNWPQQGLSNRRYII